MSAGGTSGTADTDGMQGILRLFMKYVGIPLMVASRLMHNVETDAPRYMPALLKEDYKSGVLYGATADATVGNVVDQSSILFHFSNEDLQDNAYEAIHRFL